MVLAPCAWVDEFEMIEIMRRGGDSEFSELLCRLRSDSCTAKDITTLKSRAGSPSQALHMYRLNVDVDSRNSLTLNNLAPQCDQYTIKASDAIYSRPY